MARNQACSGRGYVRNVPKHLSLQRCKTSISLVRNGEHVGAIQHIEASGDFVYADRVIVYGAGMKTGEVYLVAVDAGPGTRELAICVPDPEPVGFNIGSRKEPITIYQNVRFDRVG